ncbi:MAG: fructosamine kinase family protein [Saprospiraceae bacterium]|nr:fructosamine kinase family protein [Saprospiraceae bacterium]
MNQKIRSLIEKELGKINRITPVGGGDISTAYRITTARHDFFVKVNHGSDASGMFEAERAGLELIRNTGAIRTPEVINLDHFEDGAFLILENIQSKSPSGEDLRNFGIQLAHLHQKSFENYGGNAANFIGSLPQPNEWSDDWPDFYMVCRLLPQLNMAAERKFLQRKEIPEKAVILESIRPFLSSPHPSLIHGDLWGGNFLIDTEGDPVLIDPAVYYGHHQVDIAMSKLFGGFGREFYNAYYAEMGCAEISQAETDLYQLYYLLVHLNLFGSSYYFPVKKIMDRYFS